MMHPIPTYYRIHNKHEEYTLLPLPLNVCEDCGGGTWKTVSQGMDKYLIFCRCNEEEDIDSDIAVVDDLSSLDEEDDDEDETIIPPPPPSSPSPLRKMLNEETNSLLRR
jgi:hypothetical protein